MSFFFSLNIYLSPFKSSVSYRKRLFHDDLHFERISIAVFFWKDELHKFRLSKLNLLGHKIFQLNHVFKFYSYIKLLRWFLSSIRASS